MDTMTVEQVEVGGLTVAVRREGGGAPLVLVQGGASTTQGYWMSLPQELAAHATVVTLDRPGTGTSPVPTSLRLPEQATHLATVLDAVCDGPAWLVGHSLGGPVSLQLAVDRPDLVAGLVLLDPTPPNDLGALRGLGLMFGPIAFAETSRFPGVRRLHGRLVSVLSRALAKQRTKQGLTISPDFEAFVETAFSHQQATQVLRLLQHFDEDGPALTERLRTERPRLRGAIVSAHRKAGHRVTRAHQELGELTGLEHLEWSDSSHGVHLDQPERTLQLVLDHLGRSSDQAPDTRG